MNRQHPGNDLAGAIAVSLFPNRIALSSVSTVCVSVEKAEKEKRNLLFAATLYRDNGDQMERCWILSKVSSAWFGSWVTVWWLICWLSRKTVHSYFKNKGKYVEKPLSVDGWWGSLTRTCKFLSSITAMTNETSLKISHKTALIKANSSLIVELNVICSVSICSPPCRWKVR